MSKFLSLGRGAPSSKLFPRELLQQASTELLSSVCTPILWVNFLTHVLYPTKQPSSLLGHFGTYADNEGSPIFRAKLAEFLSEQYSGKHWRAFKVDLQTYFLIRTNNERRSTCDTGNKWSSGQCTENICASRVRDYCWRSHLLRVPPCNQQLSVESLYYNSLAKYLHLFICPYQQIASYYQLWWKWNQHGGVRGKIEGKRN